MNRDNKIDLILHNKKGASNELRLYLYNATTHSFEHNQTINVSNDISYPQPIEVPIIRAFLFDTQTVNDVKLYLCISNSSNDVNYMVKLSFDHKLRYIQEAETQLPAFYSIITLSQVKDQLYIGAICPQSISKPISIIYAINTSLNNNSTIIFEEQIKGIIADISSFKTKVGEILVIGVSKDNYNEDDVLFYYLEDNGENGWKHPAMIFNSDSDLIFQEAIDFKIRAIITSKEPYLESLIVAANKGIYKTTVIAEIIEKDVIPLYYDINIFTEQELINRQINGQDDICIPFSNSPVKSIISIIKIQKIERKCLFNKKNIIIDRKFKKE